MRKNNLTTRIFGPAILFCVLFLPGYLFQSNDAASATLNDPALLVQTLVLALPQIALIVYIILTRGHGDRVSAGMVSINGPDLLKIIAATAGLFIITVPAALLIRRSGGDFFSPVTLEPAELWFFPLLGLFALVSAYREELFFRSYLITELETFGKKAAVAVGAGLFSLGHAYQGISAVAATAIIGIFLGWLFLKTRNIHVVSISHGLYNFVVLIASLWAG
jgi:membrane protease YdiL (CAAX protease family)